MSIILIGYAANNLLPIRLGEIVRALIIEKRYDIPKMQVMGTIVIERLFDGLVLAIFLAIIIALLGNSSIFQSLAIIAGIGFTLGTFFIAFLAVLKTDSKISLGSCSTHPSLGKYCFNSN